jgi:OOP family OmpA-OmpF porin
MPIMEKIVINTTIEPADITARMLNGKLTVEGKLVSQQQIDDMLQLLFEFFDEKNVSNQLIVSQGVTTEKGRLTLSGQVDNMLHIKLRLAAKDIMKSTGFTLKDRLVEKKLSLVGRNDANNIVPKVANTKQQQHANNEKAMTACQAELDQVMSGKNIHFASNKAIIKPESVVILDKLVSIISRCKAALSSSEVLISGYTDSKGNARYNTLLSQRRADAVRAYLNKAGIVPTLLKAKGFGEVQPIASNANKEGRARNRRITFSVINKQLVSK